MIFLQFCKYFLLLTVNDFHSPLGLGHCIISDQSCLQLVQLTRVHVDKASVYIAKQIDFGCTPYDKQMKVGRGIVIETRPGL